MAHLRPAVLAFRALAQDTAFSRHDPAIQRLDRFEDIRYPGRPHGKSLVIVHGPTKKTDVVTRGAFPSDRHLFRLEGLDELVEAVVHVLNINPDIIKNNFERWRALDVYKRDNIHLLW